MHFGSWPRRHFYGVTLKQRLFLALLAAVLASSIYLIFGLVNRGPVIAIWRADTKRLVKMSLEEYVKGVVAAEMPASFPLEALKAQAVAARTYAVYRIAAGRRIADHPEAVLSTDFRSGQAWVSRDALREKWGFLAYFRYWNRVSKAVEATRGMVLTYEGAPILSLYHSTSGGKTETVENYWGNYVPYLRSVPSPWEEFSPFWQTTTRISKDELLERLDLQREVEPDENTAEGILQNGAPPGKRESAKAGWPDSGNLIEVTALTSTGRVREVEVLGRRFSGRELREALNLKSTWFSVQEEDDWVIFRVRGNGHGVGMSQYGAAGLAKMGYSFKEILAHYYPGVSLSTGYAGAIR